MNSYWFTYNQLSEITPMPAAWNVTSLTGAPGSGGCSMTSYGTTDAACTAVYNFLSLQSGYNPANPGSTDTSNAFSTYATSPLWRVVDGPWVLSHFDATGNVTFVPNTTYSGRVKPTLKKFSEVPFTSATSQFNALAGGKVNVGYLPSQDITASTSTALVAGTNNHGCRISPWIPSIPGPSTSSRTTSIRPGTAGRGADLQPAVLPTSHSVLG